MCGVQLLRVSVHERLVVAAEDFLLRLQRGEEAAGIPALRALLTERLTAAADEIVALLEETVMEYEDRAERSQREISRQRRLLDAVLKPRVRLTRADGQQLAVEGERSQEGEQLQGLEDCGGPGPGPARTSDPGSDDSVDSDFWKETRERGSGSAENPSGCSEVGRTSPQGQKSFTQRGHLKTHSGEKPFSCSSCGRSFSENGNLKRSHTGEKLFSCSLYEKSFAQSEDLQKHVRSHTGEKPFGCSRSFTQQRHLHKHTRVHAGLTVSADTQQLVVVKEQGPILDQEDPGPHYIKEEQLDWSSGLDQEDPEPTHIKEEQEEVWSSQQGEQLQGLEDCGGPGPARTSDPETDDSEDWKETRDPQAGSKSLKNEGPPEKRFGCSDCGKRFSLKTCLNRHVRSHNGEKPFSCSVCQRAFGRRETLQMHMRIHTGEKPFGCSVCNKRFVRNTHLKRHTMTHTGEKPFSCSVCSKSFNQSGSLRQHMSIHTGDQRYSCSVCERRFPWYTSLKHHHCHGRQLS